MNILYRVMSGKREAIGEFWGEEVNWHLWVICLLVSGQRRKFLFTPSTKVSSGGGREEGDLSPR